MIHTDGPQMEVRDGARDDVALVQQGRLHVVMDDGSEAEFGRDDVMLLPPGHDAWAVGDEACVFVAFSRGNDYYAA